MIARRDLLIGAGCAAAAGAAYAMTPRKRQVLLTKGTIAEAVPIAFADWSAEDADGLVQAKNDGSLAATIYSEMVGRIYYQSSTSNAVMMLIAYGDRQSDVLQLHRPEACYPAVGFNLVSSVPASLKLGNAIAPVRRVIARMQGRQENIVYWTRIGEYLPDSASEQREVRLRTSMQGYIPDGALVRFSMVGDDAEAAFPVMDKFIAGLMKAVAPDKRPALLGTARAKSITA